MANVVDDNMYNQLKQLYKWDAVKAQKAKWQIEGNYSTEKYNQLVSQLNSLYPTSSWASSTNTNTKTNTNTSTSTPTYTQKSEYWGQWTTTSVAQPKDTSWDKWNWTYAYNEKTWYYEKTGSSSSFNSSTSWTWQNVRDYWNSLTPEQQQKVANSEKWKQVMQQYGLTAGTPATTKTEDNTPTKSWDGRDYQDNSPERMRQIADNINQFAITDPWLFDSEQAFRNAFINWKWRTPEQEAFLMDLFKNRKLYNSLDTYPADKIGSMYAHWEWVPDSYLTYLKNSNPDRYNEVMSYKEQAEDGIANESYYSDLLKNSWFGDSSNLERQKKEWLLVDENGDLIDDRRYHEMSAEEKSYRDEAATIESENLKLEETLRYLDEDLIDQYPDADYSTIMLLRSDRWSKIQKKIDANNVTLTKLQWMISYMQSERQAQDKAWAETIAQMQKNLWMYYDYTAEWMSELAQAQYAATNVTLDQADNWTDTQKQMALQSVLDDYYSKFWSIIQRSESQVINDVMALAKQKWISLSQALQENFITPLKSKDQYETLASWGSLNADKRAKLNDDTLYNTATWQTMRVGATWGSYWTNWVYQFSDSEVRTGDTIWNDINSIWHILDSDDWLRIWTYTSSKWYTYNVYATREDWIQATENLLKRSYYWMTLQDAAQKRIWQWKDISGAKSTIKQMWLWLNDTLSDANVRKFIEAMWTWEWTLKWQSLEEWAQWWRDLSGYKKDDSWYDPLLVDFFQKDPTKLTKDQWAKLKNMGYDERTYLQMRQNYLTGLAKSPDSSTVKILDTLGYLMTNYPWKFDLVGAPVGQYVPWKYWDAMWDYLSYMEYIKQNLTMDNLTKLKANGATFGSLTEWERPRIEASATRLKSTMSEEKFLDELLNIYNAYAENAWMWTLTLDDINNMYWSSSQSWAWFATPSFLQGSWGGATDIEDRDAVLAAIW